MAGGFNDTERDGLNTDDEGGVVADDRFHGGEALVENAQRIGLFKVHTAGTCGFLEGLEVERAVRVVRKGSDFDFCTLTVIVHDGEFVGRGQGGDVDRVGLARLAVVNADGAGQRLSGGG